MKLLIVESPNKVAKIGKILGSDWKVAASVGHIRDLPKRDMGIAAPAFELQYQPSERGEKVIADLLIAARKADYVYLATDPDREGEAIAWHLKDALGLSESDYDRVTFNVIDEPTIKAGIKQCRKIDMDLVHAQEARRALDRLVGYMVSPVLWDRMGASVSAGRVQSPAVRLVVDRDAQIKAFKQTKHFGAVVHFDEGAWSAQWDSKAHLADGESYMLDAGLAERAAACRDFTVVASTSTLASEAPPAPFSTSTLLQAASAKLKLDPDKAMALAQKLFELGVISYHRTDALNLSAGTIAEIRDYAQAEGLPLPATPRKFREKADAQGAHEAIRPSSIATEVAGATANEQAMYRLIRERAVACQLADATYQVNVVQLSSDDEGQSLAFEARGRVPVDAGWRSLTVDDATDDPDAENEDDAPKAGNVPRLEEGTTIQANGGSVLAKQTRPPTRYTKASLIKKLEALGIGRPSTYAAVIQNVMHRAYLAEEKRQLFATPLGIDLIGSLVTAGFGFMEFNFTRQLEERLDAIAAGKDQYRSVVGDSHATLVKDIEHVRASGALPPRFPCNKCGLALRQGRNDRGTFWICTGRPNGCDTVMDDDKGTPVERKSHPCPDCKKPMYRRKGVNGFFWSCSGFRDGCKTTLPDARGKPGKRAVMSEHGCTECGKPLIHRVKGGKAGYDFWGCSGYPQCEASYKNNSGKPAQIAKR